MVFLCDHYMFPICVVVIMQNMVIIMEACFLHRIKQKISHNSEFFSQFISRQNCKNSQLPFLVVILFLFYLFFCNFNKYELK